MLIKNFLTGTPVYYAEERLRRPISFEKSSRKKNDETSENDDGEGCPFCPKNAYMTPTPIFDNGTIKIVPNLYPFISEKEGLGFHDVVIDTPLHNERFAEFSQEHILMLLEALAERFLQLEGYEHIKYIQIFKNNGLGAGASQAHSHWQIGAQNFVPPKIRYMLDVLKEYSEKTGENYFDSKKAFITLWENSCFALVIPTDSMFTYETHIITKKSRQRLSEFSREELGLLGEALKKQISVYEAYDDRPDYNICVYNAPKGCSDSSFRFFIQLIPRKGNMAGFEFSSGCYINSVSPEACEKIMKGLL